MSIRAHPIKSIEYGPEAFNCSHDEEFMSLLIGIGIDVYDGQIEIGREHIAKIKTKIKTKGASKETKKIIAEIKKLFDEYGEDYIVFDCF